VTPTRRIVVLSIATSIATLALKFAAFALTGSVGLLSDALEGLVNVAASVVALVALTVAERPPDAGHAFGHDKAEYLSSGVEGILIVVAALGIAGAAIERLVSPLPLGRLGAGLGIAAIAGLLNLVTARLMLRVAKRHDSIGVEADARHLLADVWTTAGVLAGLGLIALVPSLALLDALIALAIAVHIGITGGGLVRRSVDGLMDRALPAEELEALGATLARALPGGARIRDLRTRKAGPQRFVEFKLLVAPEESVANAHRLCDELEAVLAARLAHTHVTIHVEPNVPP